jgi:hypothetical protein
MNWKNFFLNLVRKMIEFEIAAFLLKSSPGSFDQFSNKSLA